MLSRSQNKEDKAPQLRWPPVGATNSPKTILSDTNLEYYGGHERLLSEIVRRIGATLNGRLTDKEGGPAGSTTAWQKFVAIHQAGAETRNCVLGCLRRNKVDKISYWRRAHDLPPFIYFSIWRVGCGMPVYSMDSVGYY